MALIFLNLFITPNLTVKAINYAYRFTYNSVNWNHNVSLVLRIK